MITLVYLSREDFISFSIMRDNFPEIVVFFSSYGLSELRYIFPSSSRFRVSIENIAVILVSPLYVISSSLFQP